MAVTASPTSSAPRMTSAPPQIIGARVERRCELALLLEEEVRSTIFATVTLRG